MIIEQKGTDGVNFWPGRDNQVVVAIVDHIIEGTIESAWSWFKNPKSEVSAHFGVAKDGRKWCFVEPANTAWANGNLEVGLDLNIPWLAECWANGVKSKQINPNRRTISIEHEGFSDAIMPAKQYASTLELHQLLIAEYKIIPDRKHIIGHWQISPKSKPDCPGVGFPWSQLMADLGQTITNDNSFSLNGYQVPEPFAAFWKNRGGVEIFGLPISAPRPGGSRFPTSSVVQWFERARFENHGGVVMLGLVGSENLEIGR